MKEFVRRSNPKAKFFLCGNARDLYDRNIVDEDGNISEDGTYEQLIKQGGFFADKKKNARCGAFVLLFARRVRVLFSKMKGSLFTGLPFC